MAEMRIDELRDEVAKLGKANAALLEALKQAQAAMWDAHYGKGIDAAYARIVDAIISAAIAKAIS